MKDKKPIHKIQHGRVRYQYCIGLSWIQIDTDPKTDWPEMPEYMNVCFAIENPDDEWAALRKPEPFTPGFEILERGYQRRKAAIEALIIKAIKRKTNEQRKAYGTTPDRDKGVGVSADESEKPEKALSDPERTKRKPATPMLPFESDNDSALRTEFV